MIVVGIGSLTKPLHARVEFYAAVAQILPILMLVAAVDGRYFRERDEAPPLDRFLIRGFWVIGLIGLGAALVVVARGHDSVMLRGLVVYALMLVGALVTVYALHGPARVRSEADGTSETTTANQSTRSPDRWD